MNAVLVALAVEMMPVAEDVTDLRRFPSATSCEYTIAIANQHIGHCEMMQECTVLTREWWYWEDRKVRLWKQRKPWNLLRQSLTLYPMQQRLEWIQEIRTLIGEEAWAAGEMPLIGS